MSIETGPKAGPAPKSSGAGEARAAKSRANPDAQDADSAGQGFMSILSAVSDAPADPATDTTAANTTSDPLATAPVDPALLLAQSQLPPDAARTADAAVAAQAGGGAAAAAARTAPGAKPDASLSADAAVGGAQESRTKGLQRALGQAKSDKTAAASDAQAPAASAPANEHPQQDFKLFAAMEAQRNLQTAKEPEPLLAVLGAKTEKSQGERSLFAKAAAENTYTGAASGPGATEYASSAPADVAPVLETQAAEQVKYWISQDVQNAELKLDGLGEKPVEVRITISGNEAHVAFRSDEPQTRGVLEGAGAQLKDMLLREGVVLTGVSVGTSGSQDGKSDERRPRAGLKVGQVSAAQAAPLEAPRRVAGAAGRSVDLFV